MMKTARKMIGLILALALCCGMVGSAAALTFTDAHGNEIELDETLEAYSCVTLYGADNAARKGETNLGDLWADALRWFAVSGEINAYFEEDDEAEPERDYPEADAVIPEPEEPKPEHRRISIVPLDEDTMDIRI